MIRLERLVAPLLLAACGSGGFYGEFVEACGATGHASEELCECMAAYTETNLGRQRAERVEMLMAGSFGCRALEGEAQAGNS